MFASSLFQNCWSKQPVSRVFEQWSDLVEFLRSQSEIPERVGDFEKKNTPLISPAVYADDALRARHNVLVWGNWFAVDVDNKDGLNPLADMEKVATRCIECGIAFVIYTTTSNTMAAQCFRLMFPVNRPVEADEFDAVWYAVSQWLGCADQQTKDPSRMFTLPRQWEGADNLFFDEPGGPLDIDAMKTVHPVPVEQRRSQELAKAFKVTSADLQPACPTMISLYGPFVKDSVLSEAQTSEKGGRMFRFLCSVAARALFKGFAITADQLADIGAELASQLGRHKDDITHDANNALRAAYQSYETRKVENFTRSFPPLLNRFVRAR